MSICNRFGAPCEIESAWQPEAPQGFWLIRARQTGPYPDKSGAERIGKILFEEDKTAQGWLPIYEFRATDGAKEVAEACKANATAVPPRNFKKMLIYWWPNLFDKKGNYKEKQAA